jgi:protein-disulfide isomerase
MEGFNRRPLIPGVLALVLASGAWLPACAQGKAASKPQASGSTEALVVVNGKAITEADVLASSSEYAQKKYELLEGALNQVIEERLLEAEAAARKVGKEQVLAEITPKPVTDADVDAFYEQNKAQIQQPKEQIAPRIKQFLEQQGQQTARQEFFSQLREKYKVEYKMEPFRMEVAATGPSKGPADAPVTIVEFSDFECPFCSRVVPTLDQVRAKYGDKVRIVFRQYPLPMHSNAQKAAEASLCANDQGKFWELHDAMFQNQKALGVDQLKAKAVELGMNAETFNSCLDSNKYAAQVAQDMKEGSAAGVSGTPAMFINGRFINGAVPIDQITPVIDDELQRKGQSASK